MPALQSGGLGVRDLGRRTSTSFIDGASALVRIDQPCKLSLKRRIATKVLENLLTIVRIENTSG